MPTLEATWTIRDKRVELWRYGQNDYSVNFVDDDCSVRGTLLEVAQEIDDAYNMAEMEESK